LTIIKVFINITGMNELDKYYFFWGGPFSNWTPSEFEVDGLTFNCGEQYMMYVKAITFGDKGTAQQIMEATSPRDQKKLGRQVRNYDDKVWAEVRFEKFKKGLIEKYKLPKFNKFLEERKDKIIVEASPYDRIWGIGYHQDDANLLENKEKWGQNLLGKCIMDIAKELFD
jgi:hypothetical protein